VSSFKKPLYLLSFIFTSTLLINACGFQASQPEPETSIPSVIPIAIPSATVMPSILTICLGQEPNTLYPFGGPNAAARSVLASINDGPIDLVGYEYQPVILTQLPSLENGDAKIVRSLIQAGSQIEDADGNIVLLEKGVRVSPAGCRSEDCIITYDGTTPLEMDQMIVNFRLRPGLTWADGTPITPDDSVYAYTLARDASSIADVFLIDRTQRYESADSQSVQWQGKPGYLDPDYYINFWAPAPRHLWSQFPADQLLTADISARLPIGWGPYMLQEWAAGDHITLIKNPNYFRAADGYPKFDTLTFRFIADPNAALSELAAGRCDILDPSLHLENQTSQLQEIQANGQAQVFYTPGMTIEWLAIGITPAAYDDGYDSIYQKDRQDIFVDALTRQGIAYCLDRQSVVKNVLLDHTTVPATYLPVEHPLYVPNIAAIPFDPSVGKSLLEQAGWKDSDGDPATPLSAVTVKNVAAGTPLMLNYYTTTAAQRRQVTEILTRSLAQCGIGANVQYFSQEDLYAAGPNGLLFGRRFDLIEYAMSVNGIDPPCSWFTSVEIPSASNSWVGTNITGYKNDQYDAACRTAQTALPDEQMYVDSYRQTQMLFASELPAIPLYYRMRIAAARPDLCRFNLDAIANPLWNIEVIEIGEACQN
jgi:peptide/nickel transport system substrate-binding protein